MSKNVDLSSCWMVSIVVISAVFGKLDDNDFAVEL